MKKIILLLLSLCCICSVFAQTDSLLKKYRNMALEYNHDLKAAEKNIRASIELEKNARADQLPKIGANANFQYTGNPAELSLSLPSAGKTVTFQGNDMQYGASVSLMQPVYTGKRILGTIRLAEHQQSLANNQAEVIRTAICYQTDLQYWNTVARHEIVQVSEDFQNSMAVLVRTIQERVEAGLVDPQDLLMAEVKLNEAKYRLLQAQSNFETGRMAFNSLIGIPLQTATEIEATLPIVNPPDSLLHQDRVNRPEIEMAQDRIKIAESNLTLNDSQYKPQLSIGIDGSYSSPGYNFKRDPDLNYAAYAKLSIPLFEWGKRRSDKRMAREQIGMAIDNLNKITDQTTLEIQTAQVALQQALGQVNLCTASLDKAYENEQKALEKYKMIQRVEILPYHTLGVHKYEAMGQEYKMKGVKENTPEQLEKAAEVFKEYFTTVVVN